MKFMELAQNIIMFPGDTFYRARFIIYKFLMVTSCNSQTILK